MKSSEIPILLNLCYEIEIKMSRLYKILAEKFSDNEKIKNLLLKTADEEMNHANQFIFAKNISYRTPIEFSISLEDAKEKIQLIEETIDSINNIPLDIKDALRLSIKLEETFSEYYTHRAISFSKEKSLENLFLAMMKTDKEHVEELKRALLEVERE